MTEQNSSTTNITSENHSPRALIIGSKGAIGSSLVDALRPRYKAFCLSQEDTDYSEESLASIASGLKDHGTLDLIICCIGVLHNKAIAPEKRLAAIDASVLEEYFRINSILPALCLKHFSPLLRKQSDHNQAARFITLSAMVGSISDNQLGGWYGYRSSKAALNQIIKTASIEIRRGNKNAAIVAMHPGTTRGTLSKPYSSKVKEENYYTPEQSAARIISVADSLSAKDSGKFLNWNGEEIPW